MSKHEIDDAGTPPVNEEGAPEEPGAREETGAESAADEADVGPLEAVVRERDDLRDRLLRSVAEFDNYRKRVERERRESAGWAAASLIEEVLPILDNFELALAADSGPEGHDAYRKGVELIHRQLVELLGRRGVTPIEAVGADFDPHVHQAVAQAPAEGHRDGEVVEELRRGYRLGDRLLRPAMVKVAKA